MCCPGLCFDCLEIMSKKVVACNVQLVKCVNAEINETVAKLIFSG